jgi:CxxC motif-containing protein
MDTFSTDENSFKDFITGVMKEEIVNSFHEKFDIKLDVVIKNLFNKGVNKK